LSCRAIKRVIWQHCGLVTWLWGYKSADRKMLSTIRQP